MSDVADAAVGFLLQNVVDFIRSNYDLISEAEDSFNKLRNELGNLKGFVEDCTKNGDSRFLGNLANNVRDLVHRAEDVVETFIVESAKQKLRGRMKQLLHEGEYKLRVRNLALEVEKISKEVQQFYTTKATVGYEALKYEKLLPAEDANLKPEPAVDDSVVGLQDETEKVLGFLTQGTEQVDVISIVGMYGLGKTTLARKVFNDSRTEFHFFFRVFVEVSKDFKRKEVFLKIIKSFNQATEEMQKRTEDELSKIIWEYLQNRNYLIVLDDVWTEEAWDQLICAFPPNDKRSRVLITTRETTVAEHARKISDPHHMRFLENEEPRELLRLRVFDDRKYPLPDDLVGIEARILKRCQGLPLAIVVIAGMLRSHRKDVARWKLVDEGVKDYDPKAKGRTDYVIKLSFDNLPRDLKPCFLFLGVFSEDSEISARTLLRLWVSEGLIPPCDGNLSSEDIAAFYLQNLVDRSLVMVQTRGSNDHVKTIKIHDTLREFCKARAKEENLFHEIKRGMTSTDIDRRLCINSDLPDYASRKPSGAHVRSLLCFAKNDFNLPLDQISSILRTFKLLRVLHIRSLKLSRFPPDIYYLVLLKYICIYGDLTSLPEKMSNLWNLQTLIVYNSAGTPITIKADIWKMEQLRHLETNAPANLSETKEGSPSNANLQTLSVIAPESCKREVFARTPMLKKLGIRGKLTRLLQDDREVGLWSSSLSRLEKLENLKLLNKAAEKIHVLPAWDCFPSKLLKLTLANTLLEWKHMSTLGRLENLHVLKIKDNAFEGTVWNTEDGGFKRLKVLHIGKTDLSLWKASSNHFPMLTRLYLQHCSNLEGIPQGLQALTTLQMINLYSTNNSLVTSARRFQVTKLESGSKLKLVVYPPDL